jgi:ABC-type Na+ efflux pump permease subunit
MRATQRQVPTGEILGTAAVLATLCAAISLYGLLYLGIYSGLVSLRFLLDAWTRNPEPESWQEVATRDVYVLISALFSILIFWMVFRLVFRFGDKSISGTSA